ncbi:HEPN domain-containing protein [bacterium]
MGTIQSYYAIFHGARALLFSKGDGEKGHFCLYLAIKKLFVKEGKLDERYADIFVNGMILRENADYKRMYSKESAKILINGANEFLNKVNELLKDSFKGMKTL